MQQDLNKPVFESFDEFVQYVYEAKVYEAETGFIGSLVRVLTGGMKLKGQSKTYTDTLVSEYLNKYYTDKVKDGKKMADSIVKDVEEAFNTLNNEKIQTVQGMVSNSIVPGVFKYLTDGVVKTEGHPNTEIASYQNESMERLPLADVLARANKHNFEAFSELVYKATSGKKGEYFVNSGASADLKKYNQTAESDDRYKFIQIDTKSLGGDTIQFKQYEVKQASVPGAPNWIWQFPIYVADQITPGGGDTVDSSIYDEVIEPAGNSVEVRDKQYNSSGTNFFEENAVVISDEGKKAVNAILSQYNSISKIVVNGGASSKPTSREGGNEKLAKDRQAAGISLLNSLKKSGVAQLKGASVEAGTAKVQDGAPSESDPKNQQVSFIITGMIKSTEVVTKEPVVIEQVEKIKADSVKFRQFTFNIAVSAEPNLKTLA